MSQRVSMKPWMIFLCILIATAISVVVFAESLDGTTGATPQGTDTTPDPTITAIGMPQAQDPSLPQGIREIKECHEVTWTTDEPVRATCNGEYVTINCTDPPANKSCTTQRTPITYDCVTGTTSVPHQRTDCNTNGYLLQGQTIINTQGYTCTVTTDGKTYLTCDSNYDGNGDGICTSGESCIQFGIVGTYVTRKERNSQDQFVDADTSFVLSKAEVLP